MLSILVFTHDGGTRELCNRIAGRRRDISVVENPQNWTLSPSDHVIWDSETVKEMPAALANLDGSRLAVLQSSGVPEHSSQGFTVPRPLAESLLEFIVVQWAARHKGAGGARLASDREILERVLQFGEHVQALDVAETDSMMRIAYEYAAPLAVASGYCALLHEAGRHSLDVAQQRIVTQLEQGIRKMLRMSLAMFNLGLDRSRGGVNDRQSAIEDCLERSLSLVRRAAEERQVALTSSVEPADRPVYVGEMEMDYALEAVLDSALRCSAPKGRVAVKAYPVRVAVGDAARAGERFEGAAGGAEGQAEVDGFRIDIAYEGRAFREPEPSPGLFGAAAPDAKEFDGEFGLKLAGRIVRLYGGRIDSRANGEANLISIVVPGSYRAAGTNSLLEESSFDFQTGLALCPADAESGPTN